jgi:hypothetical protein
VIFGMEIMIRIKYVDAIVVVEIVNMADIIAKEVGKKDMNVAFQCVGMFINQVKFKDDLVKEVKSS